MNVDIEELITSYSICIDYKVSWPKDKVTPHEKTGEVI